MGCYIRISIIPQNECCNSKLLHSLKLSTRNNCILAKMSQLLHHLPISGAAKLTDRCFSQHIHQPCILVYCYRLYLLEIEILSRGGLKKLIHQHFQ